MFALVGLDIRLIGISCAAAMAALVDDSLETWDGFGMVNLDVFSEIAGLAPTTVFSELKLRIAMRALNGSAMFGCGS